MRSSKQIGRYTLEKEIGRGSFSIVYKAFAYESGQRLYYAIKCISKQTTSPKSLAQGFLAAEVGVMRHTNHSNVLHLFDFFETKHNYYLVVNYCPDGDLETFMRHRRIKFFKESDALSFLNQIRLGLVELRRLKIIHRDLKLSNVFVDGNRLVIGDFGLSKAGREAARSRVGTLTSMAPEVMSSTQPYTSKADLWSVGVILYRLLFGKEPFFALSPTELIEQIRRGSGENLALHTGQTLSPQTEDLLRRLLQEDQNKRISWEEFFSHKSFELVGHPPIFSKSHEIAQVEPGVNSLQRQSIDHIAHPLIGEKRTTCLKEAPPWIKTKELYKSYLHEVNKSQFVLNTADELLKFSNSCSNSFDLQSFIRQAAGLLHAKFQLLNARLQSALVARTSQLKISGSDISLSPSEFNLLASAILKARESGEEVRNRLARMPGGFEEDKEFLGCKAEDLDFQLKLAFLQVTKLVSEVTPQLSQQPEAILLLAVLLGLAVKLEEMFPYRLNSKRFSWQRFARNYAKMAREKLISILTFLREELESEPLRQLQISLPKLI